MGADTMAYPYRQEVGHNASNYVVPGCVMRLLEEGLTKAVSLVDSPQAQYLNPPKPHWYNTGQVVDPLSWHPIIVLSTQRKESEKIVTFAVVRVFDIQLSSSQANDTLSGFNHRH
jgi:hypothetical protein